MRETLKYFLIIYSTILSFGCSKENVEPELVFPKPIDSSKIGKISTVVILGNSIVRNGPDPNANWLGDWGMAASSIDNDFVHILIRNLKGKNNSINIKYKNIADFEANFTSFSMSTIDSLKNADLIVLKIAENVKPEGPNYNQFINYYDSLIRYLDPNNKAVKIVVDGFWNNNPPVNSDIRNYAVNKKYPMVSITDLSSKSNMGLNWHPNDQGMQQISERLWKYISNYF